MVGNADVENIISEIRYFSAFADSGGGAGPVLKSCISNRNDQLTSIAIGNRQPAACVLARIFQILGGNIAKSCVCVGKQRRVMKERII